LIEPGIEMIVNEATELCQIGKKRYVDIGTVATKREWEKMDSLHSLVAQLFIAMEPLLDLMRKVDCLPTLWQQEDEERKLLAEFLDLSGKIFSSFF
jgi:hypothetical protein